VDDGEHYDGGGEASGVAAVYREAARARGYHGENKLDSIDTRMISL
jgi:hypothetical protein